MFGKNLYYALLGADSPPECFAQNFPISAHVNNVNMCYILFLPLYQMRLTSKQSHIGTEM